ncbi:MAG: CapA family protein [Lachnospiraceae bacterium]|nr:CapA family protein [Lachnospiraceae bacterium]
MKKTGLWIAAAALIVAGGIGLIIGLRSSYHTMRYRSYLADADSEADQAALVAAEDAAKEESAITGEIVESEEEDAATGEVKTLTLSATGDCTLGVTQEQGYSGTFDEYYDDYGEDYFFDGVRDIFAQDDLTIINLECVLSTSEDQQEKAYNLKGKPEYVGILTGGSVEACSMGNNHTYDYGEEGFDETVSVVENAGITYAYTGSPGMFISDEGVRVGIVSASLLSESEETVDTMKEEIRSLQDDGAEVIVACCHWGIEKEYEPTEFQRSSAHALIDAGADLIIGNHPHVLQGVEVYEGKVICYSLGNFCFGGNMDPEDKNTMIYQQTFTIVGGELQTGEIDADIIPCRISSSDGYNDFQPMVASGETKDNIIQLVNEYSAAVGTTSFDAEGKLLASGQ